MCVHRRVAWREDMEHVNLRDGSKDVRRVFGEPVFGDKDNRISLLCFGARDFCSRDHFNTSS